MIWSIYVMTNEAMPGLVKVGGSVAPEIRAAHMSGSSGCPLPFTVQYEGFVDFGHEVEREAHRILGYCRVNPGREFFRTDVQTAIRAIELAALMAAWNKAAPEARREFLDRIEAPVSDRRTA